MDIDIDIDIDTGILKFFHACFTFPVCVLLYCEIRPSYTDTHFKDDFYFFFRFLLQRHGL